MDRLVLYDDHGICTDGSIARGSRGQFSFSFGFVVVSSEE